MKLPVAISPRTRPIKLSRNTSSPCIGEKTGEGHLNDAPHLALGGLLTHHKVHVGYKTYLLISKCTVHCGDHGLV